MGNSRKIGITSTLPVEVILAADHAPVDLNNVFIQSSVPRDLILRAEEDGFPRTVCSWIKGIYRVVMDHPEIRSIIGVTQGDCSNTKALLELLEKKGREVLPFEFPGSRESGEMRAAIERLMGLFGTDWEAVMRTKRRLDRIRRKLAILDELTWRENKVSGFENHLFLVSSSDFDSDPDRFERKLDEFLSKAETRPNEARAVRLGFLGVPPIVSGIHDFVESLGAVVVFNEVQRQFAMLNLTDDLTDQYLLYTYPYGIAERIKDISRAIRERNLDGLIHYTQSFCFRQIQDILLRETLPVPILTVEGDRPGPLDAQTRNRIEAFVEVLF
ncbi:MAG: 2-hydroxyacyl-CoA dehydratase [Deltaproteobacteria bacterium]|nr:2-hydroxyacyl-CoA dehydratase [Deltaproteobacteria bacterium]